MDLTLDIQKSKRPSREQKRQRTQLMTIVFVVIGLHALALVGAGIWVIARALIQSEAVFESTQKLIIPAQNRQHRMRMARHEALAPKPTYPKKLVSTQSVALAIPDLPSMDLDQMLPLDPSQLIADQITGLAGRAGLGSGQNLGIIGSGGKGAQGISFFGLQTNGKRLVLLFDVSGSAVNKATANGVPLSLIKQETIKLIQELPIEARFNLVQFVRNFKPFKPDLIVASQSNRKLAIEWIETQWNESGQMARGGSGVISENPNGFPSVLKHAFASRPEVIFILSDGEFSQTYPSNRRVPFEEIEKQIKSLQDTLEKSATIHFLAFEMPEAEQRDWRRLCQRYGGKLRVLKRENQR